MGKVTTLLVMSPMFLACGAVCETRCGMFLTAENENWTCESVQRQEDLAVKHLPIDDVCGTIRNYSIRLAPGSSFRRPLINADLAGITDCAFKNITLTNEPVGGATLVHELAHAADGCSIIDWEHSSWHKNGYFEAIDLSIKELQ